jgi:hypothetical protein
LKSNCHQSNQTGRAVANLIEENENILLTTTKSLGTRRNPTNFKLSTIDLTLMSPHLGMASLFTLPRQ